MTNDELLHKWVNGTLTAEERAAFEERPEYEDLVKVYQHTEHLLPPSFDVEANLTKVLQTQKATRTRMISMRRTISFAMAAAVALLIMVFFQNRSGDEPAWVATTEQGQQTQGALPDQSTYQLNAGSRIAFDADSWEEARIVTLEGEAYFAVQKGETFTVNSAHGAVTVLGTRFNVRDRDGILDVSCQSGKVQVLDENGQEMAVLEALDAVRIQGEEVSLRKLMHDQQPGWTNGNTHLDSMPFTAIIHELERQYKVSIDIPKGEFKSGSLSFPNDDLESALKVVEELYNIRFTATSSNTYTFSTK